MMSFNEFSLFKFENKSTKLKLLKSLIKLKLNIYIDVITL